MRGVAVILILILASSTLGSAASPADVTKGIAKVIESGPAPVSEADREEAALALIPFPWRQLKYQIVFLGPRRGFRAMTIPKDRRIEIYARPADDLRLLAYDIAHELGHAIDLTLNTKERRKEWMEARGIDQSTPWFGCDRCSDYNTPAGDFAETFAFILLGPGHFSGRIAPAPTVNQIAALASFFPGSFHAQLTLFEPESRTSR